MPQQEAKGQTKQGRDQEQQTPRDHQGGAKQAKTQGPGPKKQDGQEPPKKEDDTQPQGTEKGQNLGNPTTYDGNEHKGGEYNRHKDNTVNFTTRDTRVGNSHTNTQSWGHNTGN